MDYFINEAIKFIVIDGSYVFEKDEIRIVMKRTWKTSPLIEIKLNESTGYVIIPSEENQESYLSFSYKGNDYSFKEFISDGNLFVNDFFKMAKTVISKGV